MRELSRRKLIGAGLAAGGAAALGNRILDAYGLVPPGHAGISGPGNTLTYASQRLITAHSLAREFPKSAISTPFAKIRPFQNEAFDRLRPGGFAEWSIDIAGLVAQPGPVLLRQLRQMPARTQITQLACEEGWSFIAEWTGVQLSEVLRRAGAAPQARYVVYYSIQPNWWHSIDMADALHPQTLLVHRMNGADLPYGHGGPLRLSVPRQLGYKSVKYITRLVVTDSLEKFRKGGNYSWYAGI